MQTRAPGARLSHCPLHGSWRSPTEVQFLRIAGTALAVEDRGSLLDRGDASSASWTSCVLAARLRVRTLTHQDSTVSRPR